VTIKSLNDLLTEKEPNNIMYGIERAFKYLFQAKVLKLKGIFMADDFFLKQREYFSKQNKVKLSKKDSVLRLSNRKLNDYLKLADEVTIKEILYIMFLIKGTWQSRGNYKFVSKDDLYILVLKILNRRNDNGQESFSNVKA